MSLRDQVVIEALSWCGTKFVHQGRTKGVGCDCAGLVIGVATNIGLAHQDVASYPRRPDGKLPGYIASQLMLVNDLQEGDILLMTFTESPSHVAIYIGDNEIVHAYAQVRRCVRQPYDDTWKRRTRGVFRFKELM